MFTENQNFLIVQTELDSVFFQEFDYENSAPGLATSRTASIFKPLMTDHAAYIEAIYKQPGYFSALGEVAVVPETVPTVANKFTTYIVDFANSITISKDLFDDNMHSVWAETVKNFAMAARATQDKTAFSLFNNAFTTTLTADGAALISSHTLLSGVVQSNLISGGLTDTTLYNAMVALQTQKNEAGVVMGNQPSILLVPPALWKTAIQLTDSALIVDTSAAQNAVNVYRSAYGITVYQSPFLAASAGGSDTAWFLLARNHAVTRVIRQGIQTALRDWSMSNNRTYLYQANYREAYKCANYVGLVGSTGL